MDNREYRRAYLVTQQQLLTDEEFDQTSDEDLDNFLNDFRGNVCSGSETEGFYHRPNTYPRRCRTCDINTDRSTDAWDYRGENGKR